MSVFTADATAVVLFGVNLSWASITSVAIFLVVAYSSYRTGLFSTLATLFMIVLSATVATTLFVPLSRIPLLARMGWYTPPICLMGTFLICLVAMQTVANYLYPPRLEFPKGVHRAGGAVLGLLNAYFLTGFLMVCFALFPGSGGPEDKVVFLKADLFFAKSMGWISRRAGSVAFNAEEFLEKAKKEKWQYSVRQREYSQIEDENRECFVRLDRLGRFLREYVKDHDGRYPDALDDLADYLPPRWDKEKREKELKCPVTGYRYRLFPVRNYEVVKDDKEYVLIYDALGGPLGHLGKGEGKRPVLFADGHVRWIKEEILKGLLAAQRKAMEPREE